MAQITADGDESFINWGGVSRLRAQAISERENMEDGHTLRLALLYIITFKNHAVSAHCLSTVASLMTVWRPGVVTHTFSLSALFEAIPGGLHSELQASQEYIVRSCPPKKPALSCKYSWENLTCSVTWGN